MVKINKYLDSDVSYDDVKHNHAFAKANRTPGAGRSSMNRRRRRTAKGGNVAGYKYSHLASSIGHVRDGKGGKDDIKPGKSENKAEERMGNRQLNSAKPNDSKTEDKSLKRREHTISPPRRNFGRFH